MSAATQTLLRTVSKVVGAEVVTDAVTFFQAFEGMEQGFRERAQRVLELLADDRTAFVLVASPRRDTVEEAMFFAEKLAAAGIVVDGLVVNRLHPRFGEGLATADRARAQTLEGTPLGALYANLADFGEVAEREEGHFADLAERLRPAPVARVPFLRADVHDLPGLTEVAGHLFAKP